MGTAVPDVIEEWLAKPGSALESQASKLDVFDKSRPPDPDGWTDDAISVDVLATAPYAPGAEIILLKISEAVGQTCPAGIKTGEATAEAMAAMLNSLEVAARLGTELAALCGSWKSTIQNYRKFHLQRNPDNRAESMDELRERLGIGGPLFDYVHQQLKLGIPDRSDVMLPRNAPLAKAHNSVKEHATKILGTILGEVQQGWVFLCTEEAQDILGTYTSPLAAVPKHNLDGTVSKKVRIIHDLSSGKKFVRWAQRGPFPPRPQAVHFKGGTAIL